MQWLILELKDGAYNDPSPVWRLPGQKWGADGHHKEGHDCDGYPQQQLEQGDEQREAADLALLAVLWSCAFIALLLALLHVWGTFLPPFHFSSFLFTFLLLSFQLSLLQCLGWMSLSASLSLSLSLLPRPPLTMSLARLLFGNRESSELIWKTFGLDSYSGSRATYRAGSILWRRKRARKGGQEDTEGDSNIRHWDDFTYSHIKDKSSRPAGMS